MKTQLQLGSVGAHTVGGFEAGAISLIYTFLLEEFKMNVYSDIHVNQIRDDLNELIMKEPGRKIFINIRYPVYDDFETKSVDEKNRIRLDVTHAALLRIADYDKKLDIDKLEAIKNKILQENFSFEFVLKTFINKKNQSLVAKIVVNPQMDRFDYFVSIEESGKEKCKLLLYRGGTTAYYFGYFFKEGKWKNENELIISGKERQVEIHVFIDQCKVEYVNLTPYPKAPLFEMFKTDISKEDKEKAHQDWLHSLPPARAAIIREADN